jgi:hypothetical protein
MRIIAFLLALLTSQSALFAQFPGPGSSPAITYIGADPCWVDASSQFFIMKTGNQAYNFNTAPPQIKSMCPAGYQHGIIGGYAANPAAVSTLNTKTGGCLQKIFYDVAGAPFFGVVPAGSKVMVFCNANPDVASLPPSAFAALCGTPNPIPVAFGNYAGLLPFFHNRNNFPSDCGAYAEINASFGADNQVIPYDPKSLANLDGAYVAVEPDNIVRYGVATGCTVPALTCPPQPFIAITGDVVLCQGERTAITANAGPGYTYSWDNGSTGPTINVGPEVTTHYIVTATSQAQPQCATAVRVRVDVFTLPSDVSITVLGDPVTGNSCYGDTVQLKWKFERPIPNSFTYSWTPPKPDIVLYKDKISSIDEYTSGTYTLRVTFDNGCILERTQDVGYIRPVPVVVCANTPVCLDEDVTLEASAPGTNFVWSGPGGFTATGASHILENPLSGQYVVTVTNADGCTSTGSTILVVNECLPSTTVVGDWVWKDLDFDGVQDPGEPGLPNIKLFLKGDFDNDGQYDDYLDSTLTNPNGRYYFINYPTGKYRLFIKRPAGFLSVPPDKPNAPNNNDNKDSDFKWSGGEYKTDPLILTTNQVNTSVDGGLKCSFIDESVGVLYNHPQQGNIILQLTGGQAPIKFDWEDLPGNDDPQNRTGLTPGIYRVTVTDNVGCSVTVSCNLQAQNSNIANPTIKKSEQTKNNDLHKPSGTQDTEGLDAFNIYPNPANASFYVALPESVTNCTVSIYDALSRYIYRIQGAGTLEVDVKNWVSGMYLIRIDIQEADAYNQPIWKTVQIIK